MRCQKTKSTEEATARDRLRTAATAAIRDMVGMAMIDRIPRRRNRALRSHPTTAAHAATLERGGNTLV